MEVFEDLIAYLAGSAMILLSSLFLVTALLDIWSQRRKEDFSPTAQVVLAISISILTICLIFAADAVFLDSTRGAHSPWTDWGSKLGS
jgi:hypothetical protein